MGSLLDKLAAKRSETAAKHHTTIRIPRVEDPGVAFRFQAVDPKTLATLTRKVEAAKGIDRRIDIQAAFLADKITDVYLIDDSGADRHEEVTFGQLAAALTIPEDPVHALKALFADDGPYATRLDLLSVAQAYGEWVNSKAETIDRDLFEDGDDDGAGGEGN